MRISLDARFIGYPGIGRFISGLWNGLIEIGTDVQALINRRGEQYPAGAVRPIRARPLFPLEQVVVPWQLHRMGAHVHHSPHLTVPYLTNRPVVLTVHDLFPLRDTRNARSRTASLYYRAAFPAAIKRATKVVAISEYARDEIQELVGVPEEKLAVVEHGLELDKWRPRDAEVVDAHIAGLGIRKPYLLYVGTAKRHKNLRTLLQAVIHAQDLPVLVLAGPTQRELSDVLSDLDAAGRVHTIGHTPDDLLPSIYNGAAALALPSLYEAVGFTALEAMACGTAVVSSDGGGLPKTVGNGGLLVPPLDVDAWIESLRSVCTNESLRQDLIRKGRAQVSWRSWRETARGYLRVYEGAIASR